MSFINPYKGLPRTVYVIFAAQIINRLGDFVMPFLTLFLTVKLGYSVALTGTVVMAASLMSIPGGLLGGKVADHIGRVYTYSFFQSTAGILILLCAFFSNGPAFIPLILASAFFNGAVRPIIGAILADVLSPEKRQAGFSLSYLGINVGVALGPIIAGFLFNHYLVMIFVGDALTSFLAVVLVLTQIPESMPQKPDLEHIESLSDIEVAERSTWGILRQSPTLFYYFVFTTFFSATYVQCMFALPLLLNKLFGEKGPAYFGTISSLNAITVVVLTASITWFARHLKPIEGVALGGAAYAIGFGLIGLIHSMPLFWITTIIWTLGEIIISTNHGVYIAERSPDQFRARINAVSNICWAVGGILGTAVMGIFIDFAGLVWVWPVVATFSAVGVFGMLWIRKQIEA